MEELVKQILGDLVFKNAALQVQLQEANKKSSELQVEREKVTKKAK